MTALPPRDALLPMLQHLRQQITALHPAAADDEQLFVDTLDGETDALTVLRTIIRRAIEVEVMSEVLSNRVREMRARRDRLEAHAEACRDTVRDALETLGLKRLEDAEFTASVGAGPQRVVITDLDVLPDAYKRLKVEADKIALSRALKAGDRIAGAELSNGGQQVLTIRRG